MRRGLEEFLVLDECGEIFAIDAGIGPRCRHERGTAPMQRALCKGFAGRGTGKEEDIVQALRDGVGASGLVPDLLGQNIINQNFQLVRFEEGRDAVTKKPAALLTLGVSGAAVTLNDSQLALWGAATTVGAWDERGLVFKVVGGGLVSMLRTFARKLVAGEGCFAGELLVGVCTSRTGGAMVALHTKFGPKHLAAAKRAQERYEAALLLRSRSRVDELRALVRSEREAREKAGQDASHLRMPGDVWPLWRDGKVGAEVRYGLAPGYGEQAQYGDSYTFEQLAAWSLAKNKYLLQPDAHRTAGCEEDDEASEMPA